MEKNIKKEMERVYKEVISAVNDGCKFTEICVRAGLTKSGKGCILPDGTFARAEKLIRMASDGAKSYRNDVADRMETKTSAWRFYWKYVLERAIAEARNAVIPRRYNTLPQIEKNKVPFMGLFFCPVLNS